MVQVEAMSNEPEATKNVIEKYPYCDEIVTRFKPAHINVLM